jgi:hypothetical protein
LHPLSRRWAELILNSHQRAFGQPLLVCDRSGDLGRLRCQELFSSASPVLAHNSSHDPTLIYANAAALQLWQTTWHGLIGLPSRLTAPESERRGRQRALVQAHRQEAIKSYSGLRISRCGRRFMICNARIWSVHDDEKTPCGQAASIGEWWWI